MKILKRSDSPDFCRPQPPNLIKSRWKKKYYVLVEAFFSNISRFSKSILPFNEQKHACLVSVAISKAVKDHINFLLINELYNHRNTPNLLDTPQQDIFYKYPLTSIYHHFPKLVISGEVPTSLSIRPPTIWEGRQHKAWKFVLKIFGIVINIDSSDQMVLHLATKKGQKSKFHISFYNHMWM